MQEESDILLEVASSDVIMVELLIYCAASIVILMLMSAFAKKKLGGERMPGYQALSGVRTISVMICCGFTFIVGMLCLTQDFSCTRGTLTYFGLPYLLALIFYMFQMFGRIKAEKGRRL